MRVLLLVTPASERSAHETLPHSPTLDQSVTVYTCNVSTVVTYEKEYDDQLIEDKKIKKQFLVPVNIQLL